MILRFSELIAIQFPIVFCLIIQCYQTYKLGFKEFKLLTIAWGINFIYLVINFFVSELEITNKSQILENIFDLLNMSFFLLAILDTFTKKEFIFLKKIQKIYIILFIIAIGITPLLFSSWNVLSLIDIRKLPIVFIDSFVLFSLAIFFKKRAIQFNQKKFLYFPIFFYASIQSLNLLHKDTKIYDFEIDIIGFSLGLLSKVAILIFLSKLMVNAVSIKINLEKDNVLEKLSAASKNILSIKNKITENFEDRKDLILNSVLSEILPLINKEKAYYSRYDQKKEELVIKFSSDYYNNKIDKKCTDGLSIASLEKKQTIIWHKEINGITLEGESNHTYKFENEVKSAIAIPVIIDDIKLLGVFLIVSEQQNDFSEVDVSFLNFLVAQAITAIKNNQLIHEIELSRTFLNSLENIDKTMLKKSLELKEVLEIILNQSLEIVKAEWGSIALKTSNSKLTIIKSSDSKDEGREFEINDSVIGLVVLSKDKIYIPDISLADARLKKLHKKYIDKDFTCELAVPLIAHDEVIGVINIESSESDNFSENDIKNLMAFAGQTSIAIYIFKLFEDVKKHRDHLETLSDIELKILNSNQSLSEILESILLRGLKLINKKHGEILLCETDGESKFFVVKKSSMPPSAEKRFSQNSISGIALKKKKIVYLPYIDKTAKYTFESKQEHIYIPTDQEKFLYKVSTWGRMKSELVLPLIIKNEVIGVFNIESDEYDDFSIEEIKLLTTLTRAAAIAINNALQFEEINTKNRELKNSVAIDKVMLSNIHGQEINHRIGNSIGLIRTILRDKLLFGQYGEFSQEVLSEFNVMLKNAERVLKVYGEISTKLNKQLFKEQRPINFNDLKNQIEQNDYLKAHKNIKISILGFENLQPVPIDAELFMDTIVMELITNAIKSMMPNGGEIIITGSIDEDYNIITFKDHGHGIKISEQKNIYSKTYTKWEKSEGSGSGLHLIKSLLDIIKGKIEVESELGKGTIFTIKLPYKKNKKNII